MSVQQPTTANRSTGPRTPEGKAVSCLNNFKHGLTGDFRVLQSESQETFFELRNALRAEHAPATATESLLVDRMVEHVWLSQRAGRFQNEAARDGNESWFALMLRYQTTHDRGFHRCLAELRTMRRERRQNSEEAQRQEAQQFESQNAELAANTRLTNARAAEIELRNSLRLTPAVQVAGPAPTSFRKNNHEGAELASDDTDRCLHESEKAAA